MNVLKLTAVAAAVVLAACLGRSDNGGAAATRPDPSAAIRNRADDVADRPPKTQAHVPYHGMAIQVNGSHEPMEQFGTLIDQIADLGADTILISTAGYQENSSSGVIFIDQRKTPSDGQWDELLRHARRRGLRVVLMPIVLLTNPRTSTEWRGVIAPPRWDEWWASYTDYVLHYAKIAARNGAEVFIIGSELISTEKQPEMWDQLIAKIRAIYHGKISYSSNWDHYEKVPLWDKVDLVCMTTYHKLADEENPPLATLLENWKPVKRDILKWQAKVGKPILFTEVGWPSQAGCSIEPWNYYRHDEASPEGLAEQANCYEAFVRTWGDELDNERIAGVLWWEWTNYGGGPTCNNYTPKGKPAEKILRRWFEDVRQARRPRDNDIAASSQPTAAMP